MLIRSVLFLLCGVMSGSALMAGDGGTEKRRIEFNRDIRPILSDNCFYCHGPDRNKREADLRLDTLSGLHGEGGSGGAIIPGRADESPLIQRVTSGDAEVVMPPPSSGKVLTAEQIRLLRAWIEQGGEYQGHWSFLPIAEPSEALGGKDSVKVAAKIDELVERDRTLRGLTGAIQA
ncbi:MAG: hypothetical protein RLZZ458_1543, partial [Planctomycetota bacterium]